MSRPKKGSNSCLQLPCSFVWYCAPWIRDLIRTDMQHSSFCTLDAMPGVLNLGSTRDQTPSLSPRLRQNVRLQLCPNVLSNIFQRHCPTTATANEFFWNAVPRTATPVGVVLYWIHGFVCNEASYDTRDGHNWNCTNHNFVIYCILILRYINIQRHSIYVEGIARSPGSFFAFSLLESA